MTHYNSTDILKVIQIFFSSLLSIVLTVKTVDFNTTVASCGQRYSVHVKMAISMSSEQARSCQPDPTLLVVIYDLGKQEAREDFLAEAHPPVSVFNLGSKTRKVLIQPSSLK